MNNEMTKATQAAADAFRKAITNAIVPLQTERVYKENEFYNLEKETLNLVNLLKGQEYVSKSLLNEFFVCARILRNEASFSKSAQHKIEAFAQKMEHYLSLVLLDEVPQQRVPGVPRVL